jgi:hypothetical protein
LVLLSELTPIMRSLVPGHSHQVGFGVLDTQKGRPKPLFAFCEPGSARQRSRPQQFSTTPMLSTVLAGIAEFERELIRERIGAHADLRNLCETATSK